MKRWLKGLATALATVAVWQLTVLAQAPPETFSATASVKRGGASGSAPFTVTVTRYSTDAEREAVLKAVRSGGSAAVSKVLASMPDAGFMQLADRKTTIKFAGQRPIASGRLVTVVSAEPILFLGGGAPAAQPKAGFEVAVAMLNLEGGKGTGELVPAAKVGVDDKGALLIDDYGAAVVWLNNLAQK